jgi:hypothetical protein
LAHILAVALAAVSCDIYHYSNLPWEVIPLWCGEKRCKWQVVEGGVEKTATWHEKEYAIGLEGDTAIISRETPLAEIYDMSWVEETECILFTVLADADKGVELFLEIVVPGGGS